MILKFNKILLIFIELILTFAASYDWMIDRIISTYFVPIFEADYRSYLYDSFAFRGCQATELPRTMTRIRDNK